MSLNKISTEDVLKLGLWGPGDPPGLLAMFNISAPAPGWISSSLLCVCVCVCVDHFKVFRLNLL